MIYKYRMNIFSWERCMVFDVYKNLKKLQIKKKKMMLSIHIVRYLSW